MTILNAYFKAIRQLPDPRFVRVVAQSVLGTFAALVLLWILLGMALSGIVWEKVWLLGSMVTWLGDYADNLGWFSFLLGVGGLTLLLFPAAATATMSLFQDQICAAVEARHYPQLQPPIDRPWPASLGHSLRFLTIAILANIAAIPFYLVLFLIFGSGAFLFFAVNGYLIGREMFELVAYRRLPVADADRLRRSHRLKTIYFGAIGVLFMSIPVINLVAPVITAAAAVHLYQGLKKR